HTWTDASDKTFEYIVVSRNGFTGEVSIALLSPPADVEVRSGPTPRSLTVGAGQTVDGSFVLHPLASAATAKGGMVVTATGPDGTAQASTLPLSVVRPLELSCTRQPDSGPAPLIVTFHAQGRECAGDCSYRWDFGDGEVSLEPNPTHLYREPGQYN